METMDKTNIIQSFGPNCVISLNMPPAITSDQTLSSKNSSICSSPIYKNDVVNNKTSSLSGSTSDLAKSLSTIYAMPDEQIDDSNNGCKEQITAISTNSIYYNYPVVGVSTTNLLQTFPTVRQNRERFSSTNDSKIITNRQSSPIMYLNDTSTNNSDHSWYRGSDLYSASEETDPYDTDEFDYCSTENEDEIEIGDRTLVNEFHKTSSDDGNGTLEDESITNSISTSSLSKSEINNDDEIFNVCKKSNEANNGSTTIEVNSNNELNFEISSSKKVIDFNIKPTEINLQIDQKAKNDHEQNKNVEAERFPINQIKLKSLQTSQQLSPYKKSSIIKIKSPTNVEATVPTIQDMMDSKSSERNESSSMVTSTTTIRLLNTNKIASNHNRLDNNNDNNHIAVIKNKNSYHSVAKMRNKLSHPYLCRLRAANGEEFERNPYSKKTTTISKQIPDIQGV
nr:GATA zinc finger domain-containing protein 14-like isoform X2 [Dermatophagoides farinae]